VPGSSVTRRYAKALFDLVEPSTAEAAGAALLRLSETITTTAPLRHLLASPAFSVDEKLTVLSLLCERLGAPSIVNRFVGQLVKRNRIAQLAEIAEAFEALVDEAKARRKVQVRSARPLGREEEKHLRTRLRDLLRHDVDVEFLTQPSLLSGLQVRIGSLVYDSTARSRLTAMQSFLTKE
jgi:F-type H+-transporting ATPase subunit delta